MKLGWPMKRAAVVLEVSERRGRRALEDALQTIAVLEFADPSKTANTRCLFMHELGLIPFKPGGPTWLHNCRMAARLLNIGNGRALRDRQLSYLVEQALRPAFIKQIKLMQADWLKTEIDRMESLNRVALEHFNAELTQREDEKTGRADRGNGKAKR